jgi:hypothetical protein
MPCRRCRRPPGWSTQRGQQPAACIKLPALTLFLLLCALQGPDGAVKVAAAAGSALQPLAVVLLEAASLEQLTASKAEDWQVIEKSAATQVCGMLVAAAGGAATVAEGRGAAADSMGSMATCMTCPTIICALLLCCTVARY